MVRTWLILAVCTAAFGGSITYNYTGNTFTVCDGVTSITGNCPASAFSDHNVASLTFSAPLSANLSSASPSPTAWTIGDALGLTPSFASTDANAATELTALSLSTNSSGAITGWVMTGETTGFTFSPGFQAGSAYISINNPTFIGGSGFPNADDLVFGGNGGNTNVPGGGWSLSDGLTGMWTETLTGFQGGTTAAPVFLIGGSSVAALTGTISGLGAEDYYIFYWGGGAFSASASITGASGEASYVFSAGVAGSCSSAGSETLNSGDGFSDTIAVGNLAAGRYCIGLDANSGNDPNFSVIFNTPVSSAPEPSSFVLLFGGLGVIGVLRHAKRARERS